MTDSTTTPNPEEATADLEAAYVAVPNETREYVEDLLRSGVVTEETTLADLKTILAKHYAVQQ